MAKKIFNGKIGRTIMDTEYSYEDLPELRRADAPNVVYIVIDDLGFAQLGCYGSNIDTPNIDRLAQGGLRYNNFHTTAICSATRASLLTGANHHAVGINSLVEWVTGTANGEGHINPGYATIAEILHEYDYDTCACGKWHLAPDNERKGAGPFQNWPLQKGFDKYYGFLHAMMNQWNPILAQDNSLVDQPKSPEEEYHFSEDITDHAIEYISNQKNAYPDKPFFLYLAYGAMHAPQSYIDKYRGHFSEGWDVLREKWFKRQKELGIIPENAELNPRNEYVPAWDSLSAEQKKINERYMEAFAGMLDHTDEQIGRVIDYLEKIGQLEHTVIVLLSDNGATSEGGPTGRLNFNSGHVINLPTNSEEEALAHIDEIGGPHFESTYPAGWANLGNTPFPWYKTWVHSGGIKDPLIIHYPEGIHAKNEVRGQFVHVSDITPTILDIIGVRKPNVIKGVPQKPLQGTSIKYSFDDADAREFHYIYRYFDIPDEPRTQQNSFSITAIINRKSEQEQGTIYSVGNSFGGWSFYILENKLHYTLNVAGNKYYHLSSEALPAGRIEVKLQVRLEEDKTASIFLYLADTLVGTLEIDNYYDRVGNSFHTIGADRFNPASNQYASPFIFEGEIEYVKVHTAASKTTAKERLDSFFEQD